MNPTTLAPLDVEGEQLALLLEVLESAHARLLVGIRHTAHRLFREEFDAPGDSHRTVDCALPEVARAYTGFVACNWLSRLRPAIWDSCL